MMFSLAQKINLKVQTQCRDRVTTLELKDFLELSTSAIQDALPVRLSFCYLQQEALAALKCRRSYQKKYNWTVTQNRSFNGGFKTCRF